jgi:two-component system NarL family response regulator
VELYRKHRPDVALLDVRMPGIGGLEALRRVRAEHAEACVVMLSTAEFDEEVQQAVEAGAMGYIGKTSTTAALVAALKGAARGERQFSPGLLRSLKAATRLAPRELEVLTGMARGWSNKEIAARLHLSTHTVKTYVKGVLEKLGVPDRAGAVSEGFRRGILKV